MPAGASSQKQGSHVAIRSYVNSGRRRSDVMGSKNDAVQTQAETKVMCAGSRSTDNEQCETARRD